MIGRHLKAVLWLRWRIRVNQIKRAGRVNAVLTAILYALGLIAVVASFFVSLVVGILLLPEALPDHILYLWDGIIAAFLFFWVLGVITEFQRSDGLSIEKLLHLPVSPAWAFALNYLSSLLSGNLVFFVPVMLGLSLALVVVKGPCMIILFPLVAGLILMVTALTYQLRGWLATLMVNKRRRRTIIVLVTLGFVLLSQIPYLLGTTFERSFRETNESLKRDQEALRAELEQALSEGRIDKKEYAKRLGEDDQAREDSKRQMREQIVDQARRLTLVVNAALPPAWPAYGAMAAAGNDIWPGLLGSLGVFLIAFGSLWRSYRTTLRFYRGEFQAGGGARAKTKKGPPLPVGESGRNALEYTLPWFSENATVIALANLRAVVRAPEVKMVLLSPILFFMIFGSMFLTGAAASLPVGARPLAATGAITLILFSLSQLFQNQFGLDRNGFRVYVLAPAPRRDILQGKNLSLAPIALSFGAITVSALQIVLPMHFSHFLAALLQVPAAFLIACMLGNLSSILAPMAQAFGSMRWVQPKTTTTLLQLLIGFMLPVAMAPILVPLGVETLLIAFGWGEGWPICLLLTIAELVALWYVYQVVLTYQGGLLGRRQLKILDAVNVEAD